MVELDSSKRYVKSSLYLLNIVASTCSKLLASGIESATFPEPIILLRYRIVRPLTVINAKLLTNGFGNEEKVSLQKLSTICR